MSTDVNLANQLKPAVATLRLIVTAFAGGVVVFAVVAVFARVATPAEPIESGVPFLTLTALVLFPLALAASRLLPAAIAKSTRRQIAGGEPGCRGGGPLAAELGDAAVLYGTFQTKTIIAAAVLEGVAFLSILAFLLEGSLIALALAALLVAAIVAMFPSSARVTDWIQRQLRLVKEEKLLAR